MKKLVFLLMFLIASPALAQEEAKTETKNYLLEVVRDAVEAGKKIGTEAIDLVQREAPELINQLLWWEAVQSFLFMLFGIALFIIAIKISNHVAMRTRLDRDLYHINHDEKEEVYKRYPEGLLPIDSDLDAFRLFLIVPLVVGCVIAAHGLVWLKILIAPKLFLLQYFADLM